MEEPLISVIVPVCGTDIGLLKRCVNSIAGQTYKNKEIIVVLNGNPPEYDDEVRRTLDGAVVINSPSVGSSCARNAGFAVSRGEYIAFADSDDEVVPEYLEKALDTLKSTGADVAVGGITYRFDGYGRDLVYTGETKVFDGKDVCGFLLTAGTPLCEKINGYLFNSACGKLFRREVLEKTLFREDVTFYEDMLFIFTAASCGAAFALSGGVWYIYYQYSDSVLHRKGRYMTDSFPTVFGGINGILAEKYTDGSLLRDFGCFIVHYIGACAVKSDRFRTFGDFMKKCFTLSSLRDAVNAYFDSVGKSGCFTHRCIVKRRFFRYYVFRKTGAFMSKLRRRTKAPEKLINK